jgi:TRAP-type uncharacterized transport system fused permease subunit
MTSNELETSQKNWESLLLPIVLVVAGALILAAANFGWVSLDRVQNLWPAAIILVGLVELFTDWSSDERGRHE